MTPGMRRASMAAVRRASIVAVRRASIVAVRRASMAAVRRASIVAVRRASIVAVLLLGAAAGASAQDAWEAYDRVSAVQCGARPVLLQGNHTDVTLSGPCGYVRVAGEHNDVTVDLRPGGTVEITGAHNDVWWHQRAPGPPPRLIDAGFSNTFHAERD